MTRLASVALLAVLVGGCDSFLDVNEDPNAPVNARVDVRLPAIVTGVVHTVYYGDPGQWTSEWMQQTSYNRDSRGYDELQLYEVQDNSANGAWSFHYASMLNETKLMMEELDPEVDPAYYGLAKFIHAWTWAHATDLWGPIPFSEALDPLVPTPAYDDQLPSVYNQVLTMMDEAIADMKRTSLRSPGAGDLLFSGDMSRWVKLARVVQARHQLRLAYAPGENAQERAQAALTALGEGFAGNFDDAVFEYPGGDGARNPLWRYVDRPLLFVASGLTLDMLNERNDPRLPIMIEPAVRDLENGQTVYRGHYNDADVEPDSTISQVGHFFTAEDAPLNVASFADAKFTEAEARLIVSGAAAADAPYREGIRAIMEKWGVAQADIDTYLAARPSLASLANPLEEIIREKWMANYLTEEPWHDWRRTGYPQIQPVSGAFLPEIPVRIRTPESELSANADNVMATGVDPGLQGMLFTGPSVWWGGTPPPSLTGGN
jgi:hypothetical protein